MCEATVADDEGDDDDRDESIVTDDLEFNVQEEGKEVKL